MSDAPITPEQIKAARKLLGWSQSTLADRVHMSAARISAIETGKQQPSAFELDLGREALESAGVEFITVAGRAGVRLRKDGPTAGKAAVQPPTQYRVQYLDSFSTVLAEQHVYANSLAGALALVEGVAFPVGAVRMRILDGAGHLLYPHRNDPE